MKDPKNKNTPIKQAETVHENNLVQNYNQAEEKLNASQIILAARSLISNFKSVKSFFTSLVESNDAKEFFELEKFIKRFLIGIYKIFECEVHFTKDYYTELKQSLAGTCWAEFLEDPEISQSEFFEFNRLILSEKLKEKSENGFVNVDEKFNLQAENDAKFKADSDKCAFSYNSYDNTDNFQAPKNFEFSSISFIENKQDLTYSSIINDNWTSSKANLIGIDNDYNNLNKDNPQIRPENGIPKPFDNSRILENLTYKIFNFFTTFLSFLNTNRTVKEKILPITLKANLINRMISAFYTIKKTLNLPNCTDKIKANSIKILPDIHNRFVKDFLSLFDFNISKSAFDCKTLTNCISDLIKNNKSPEKIYEILTNLNTKENEAFNTESFHNQINLKLYLLNLAKNKPKLPLMKKAIRAFPHCARDVIQLYLAENENKYAMEVYKEANLDADPSNEDLKSEIIIMSKLKFFFHLFYRYRQKKEIKFMHVIEHFIDDLEVMKLILKRLFEDNMLLEAYFVLRNYNYGSKELFGKILVNDFFKLGSNFISWNNAFYRKIARIGAGHQQVINANNQMNDNPNKTEVIGGIRDIEMKIEENCEGFDKQKNSNQIKVENSVDFPDTITSHNNYGNFNCQRSTNNVYCDKKISNFNYDKEINGDDCILQKGDLTKTDNIDVKMEAEDFTDQAEIDSRFKYNKPNTLNEIKVESEENDKFEKEEKISEIKIDEKEPILLEKPFNNNLTSFELAFDSFSKETLHINLNENNATFNYSYSQTNNLNSFFNPWNFEGKNIYNNITCFKNFISNLEESVSFNDTNKLNSKSKTSKLCNCNYTHKVNSYYSKFPNQTALLINPIPTEPLVSANAALNSSSQKKNQQTNYTTNKNNNNNCSSKLEKQKKVNSLICESLRKFLFFFSLNPELNLADSQDSFAPSDKSLMHLQIPETSVFFIDTLEKFKTLRSYFSNSIYIGIDMEWKSKCCLLEADFPSPSIIQVADGKSCFILDYPSLVKEKLFYDFFNEVFTGKIFISFSFHNDIKQIDDPRIKSFFSLKSKKENIDLENEYKRILNRKTLSLSELTMEVFKRKLCKMEQVSNWNSRPLRKAQMHYAALDAHILVLLHSKMQEYSANANNV